MYFFNKKVEKKKELYTPHNSVLLSNKNPFDEFDKKQEYIRLQKIEEEKQYEDSLLEFEKTYDPYQILNINPKSSKNEVTKAYKKLALYHHPDKGGKKQLFDLLTKSYKIIIKRLDAVKPTNKIEHNDLKKKSNHFNKKNNTITKKKSFSLDKFNNTFESNKLTNINDRGYGDWSTDDIKDENINGNITKNNFNDVFKKSRRTNNYHKQIIQYDEPIAISSGDLGFSELGKDDIDNFTRSNAEGGGIGYTDYKNAYTIDSKLIDTDEISIDRPDTLNSIKSNRENISYDISYSMKRQIEQKQVQDEQKEFDRLQRVNLFDETAGEHYDKMNKLMLRR